MGDGLIGLLQSMLGQTSRIGGIALIAGAIALSVTYLGYLSPEETKCWLPAFALLAIVGLAVLIVDGIIYGRIKYDQWKTKTADRAP